MTVLGKTNMVHNMQNSSSGAAYQGKVKLFTQLQKENYIGEMKHLQIKK